MRCDPDLRSPGCLHNTKCQGFEQVGVQACLRLIQGKQSGWARTHQSRQQAKVAQGTVRKLPGFQRAQCARYLQSDTEPLRALLGTAYLQYRAIQYRAIQSLTDRPKQPVGVAYLDNGLERGGKIAPVMRQRGRKDPDLRLTQNRQLRSVSRRTERYGNRCGSASCTRADSL